MNDQSDLREQLIDITPTLSIRERDKIIALISRREIEARIDELNLLNEAIAPHDSSEVATIRRITKIIDAHFDALQPTLIKDKEKE